MKTRAVLGGVLAASVIGLVACGGSSGDSATRRTTTTASGGSTTSTSDEGSTSTSGSTSGSSSSGGSTSTTKKGTSAGIQTGAVGYFKAFKYTVDSATIVPSSDASKPTLQVNLNFENISTGTYSAQGSYGSFKLDGDDSQRADDAKAKPSGEVSPGTKGTVLVTFDVGTSFDPSAVSLVIGDPDSVEVPELPLGAGGKKVTLEPKVQTASATTPAGARHGESLTVTKATVEAALAVGDRQADKGKAFVLLGGSFKGGTEAGGVSYGDVQLKEPDGTLAKAEGFIVNDKLENSFDLSAGQSKDVVGVWILDQKTKAAGSYEIQLPAEEGDTPLKASFTLS